MAGKFKMPNKKTTIIASVTIAVLAIIAVTGTVVFLKDRGTTEAADLGNEQVSREETITTQETTNEQNAQVQTAENTGEQDSGETIEGETEGQTATATDDTTTSGTTTTTTTAGGPGTSTTTDTIQETTISRTETVEIPERQVSEGHYVGWTPMQIDAEIASADIVAQRDDLIIKKTAKTKNSENLVTKGEIITYEIYVKNNSAEELKGIEIKDRIPTMTEYKEGSADNNGEEMLQGTNVVGIKWNIDLKAGEEKVVSFQVTVSKEATGKITNVAVVNGDTTGPAETAVVTATKTATIEGKEEGQAAKVGDKITYTITVVNTEDIAGKINVKDETLAKLVEDGILKIDEASKEVATKVMEGTLVDVPANGEGKISFTVIVEKINGAIKNIATVGEEKPEKTINTTNITGEKANTDVDDKVKAGDTFDYTIVLTNSGNTEGTATVTDSIPSQLEVTGTTPTATVNGNDVDFGEVKVAPGTPVKLTISVKVREGATGDIKNVGKVDGEDVEDPEPIKTVNITKTKSNTEEDGKVKAGDIFEYKIVLTNNGTADGEVEVTDNVPEQLKVTGTTPTATVNGNDVDFGNVEVKAGETKTLTISVEVKEGATGDIKNVGKVDGEDVEDPEPIKTVNITGEKANTDEDNKVKPGDTFDYTIVLTNSGSAEGTAKVTDSIPSQLEVTGTTPTATVNGNDVDFGEVTVKPGTPVTLTISVKVKATATGTFKNIALVDGKETPDEDITIENVSKISAVKTNNDEDKKVKPGDTVVYTIKLSNSGNAEGTTTVTDKLPAGVVYQSSSDNGVHNNGTVIWENVKVPVGTNSKELTVTVKIDKTATGKLENTAIVENETEHDEGLDLVKITANKSSNITTRAKVGQEVIYTITAINNGTIAGDAVITDQIPNGLEYKEATLTAAGEDTISVDNGLITWNVKALEPGEENVRTLTIKATIKDFEGIITTITNEVKVDGEKTSETTIEAGKPVIESSKTSEIISCPERNELTGTTVHEGDKIRYTITVKNTGTVEKEITITDQIKDGLTYVDGTLTAEFAGAAVTGAKVENGIVKLENYTLTTGGTLTITFTVEVNKLSDNESSKTIDANVAVVDGTQKEDEKGDYEVLKPIITSEKESSIESCTKGQTTGTIVHENDQIRYTIKVTNSGKTSGKVTVEDTIKEGLSYVEGTAKATVDNVAVSGVTVNNGKVSLTDYTLAAEKTIVIEFTVKVNALPKDVYSKTIAANVAVVNGNDTTDTTGEYNVVKPNVESDKSSKIVECSVNQTEGNIVHVNDKIRYTITVENNGTDSDVINVTDNIPTGVTYVDGTLNAKLNDNTQVPVTIEGRQLKLSAYTLAAGKTLTITFDVTVDALEDGVYSKTIANNIAVVNGQNIPDDGGYEVQKPQIESSKVVDKATAEYDEELTYTITVKNLSTTTADVSVNDPIPEGTEYVANSITINGNAASDANNYKDGNIVYTGTLTQQNQTATITFKVKLTEKTIGKVITNTANINGEEKQATTKVVKTVTVGTESTKVTPIDLVLVLDISGSMNNNSRLSDLKSSAKTLANKVFADETTSTISVITYSSEVKSVNTYTYAQRNNLTTAIDGLSANGGTNIYAALEQANTTVSGLGTEREKVVVFLTDGAPTIPSNLYIDGVHTESNSGSGYTNNIKNPIVEKANSLKALSKVKKVYSIGLGVNSLSDSTISYAEECTDALEVNKNITFDTTNHTFTVTLTNSNDTQIQLNEVNATFSNVSSILTASNDGQIETTENWGRTNYSVVWNNITVPANDNVKLTGTYEPSTQWGWGGETVSLTQTCLTEGHDEQFDGSALFSEIKEKNGKQYHCITTQDYAKYLLSKISSDGTSMNVDTVSTAFDKILHDISSTSKTYTVEDGTVIDIPETNTIISDVTVTIGESSNSYTLDQLKAGVNGLVYEENIGFKWTITGDTLLTNKLSLEYKIDE